MKTTIAIGSDHGGVELKAHLIPRLEEAGYQVTNFGVNDKTSVDYPDIAETVCTAVLQGQAERAILICGTGLGIGIAANKIQGIRAATCSDTFSARMAREHNNANVLTLGARVIGEELAWEVISSYLNASFAGGRHQERVGKIMALEGKSFS